MKKERLHLSAGSLWKTAREYFETNTTDPRKNNGASKRTYSLSDYLMNSAAIFSLKFPSLLQFLKVIITEDGLSSNTPHIKTLEELDFSYILGCKQGDHQFLFESIQKKEEAGELKTLDIQEEQITHRFQWTSSVQLNSSSPDCVVNFLEYWEIKDKKTTHWSWVTNLALNQNTVYKIMKAGRARWRIENETFNTLKNQGYEFEHNFGHGYKNLSNVFAMQMMLAFCIDQILQLTSKIFQKALLAQNNRKKYLWETIKFHAMFFSFSNWDALFTHIAAGTMMNANPTLYYDTS